MRPLSQIQPLCFDGLPSFNARSTFLNFIKRVALLCGTHARTSPSWADGSANEGTRVRQGEFPKKRTKVEGSTAAIPSSGAGGFLLLNGDHQQAATYPGICMSGPWLNTLLSLLAVGAFGGVACQNQRGHGVSEVMGDDCVVCHSEDFERATQPLHMQQLPLDCASCHTSDTWTPAAGSMHAAFFPLKDAHAEAGCGDCHGSDFEPGETPTECSGCHRDDYDHAGHPSHEGLPTECNRCHNEAHFAPSIFEHPWPLSGHHTQAACNQCHGEPPLYEGTSSACINCHSRDAENARNPDHSNFSEDCANCHNPGGWQSGGKTPGGPDFKHPWPLLGEHASAACNGCHADDPPRYAGTTKVCIDCHREDLDRATQPPHDNFPRDCGQCHQPTGWNASSAAGGSGFVHPWPLRGRHAQAACVSCHVGDPPVYEGTPTACIDCHVDDRARAQPPHDDFPNDCSGCHSAEGFRPATFTHPWPLSGAHSSAACQSCHVGDPPVYAGTPQACVDCHRIEYENNSVAGHNTFPTTCASCHTPTAWAPASGGAHPEMRFPTSGRHNYACNQCHNPALGPNGRGNADCVGCHVGAHTRARMDAEHRGFRGYPTADATPNFCLNCHPRGSE